MEINQPYETKNIFITVILVSLITTLFIVINNFYLNDYAQKGVNIESGKGIYFIDDIEEIKEDLDHKNIDLDKALEIKYPSLILLNYKIINDDFTVEKFKKINKLIDKGHMVMYVGINIDPEKVVSTFENNNIPVVPIEGSTEVYYHSYGALYSKDSESFIPLTYASTNDKEINMNDFKNFLSEINEKHLIENFR